MSTLAQRLRTAREHAGLSQGQVARMLELHRPTVSEIEAGRRRVTADELAKFAELYDVTVGWLTSSEEDDKEVNDKIMLAARDLAKLKKDDLERVLRLLSSMTEKEK